MNDSFAFWFPAAWTIVGAVFTFLSFVLALFVATRSDLVVPKLRQVVVAFSKLNTAIVGASRVLETVKDDVGELRTALVPQGEPSIAETLRGLKTDWQALATALREAQGSTTELQAPATPVLLEILSEICQLKKEPWKIQRKVPALSLVSYKALAEALARERIQAKTNPFPELD
jgi:hypothetical protein